jgi:hypothetical protein
MKGRGVTEKQERAFWLRYKVKLTQEERRRLVNGDHAISRARAEHLPAPRLPQGEWIEVRSNYAVKLGPRIQTEKTYRYEVTHRRDFRARIPRRTPSVFDVPDLDDSGNPIPPTSDAITEATETGNYTSSHALSVPDCEEAVDPFTQSRITKEARERRTKASTDVIAAAEDVMAAIRERAESSPDFKREAKLTLHRMRRELDRFIERERRKAA